MRMIFPRLLGAAAFAGWAALLVPASAFAADCPAGKEGTDVTKPGPTKPVGVTDTLISSIDLSPMGSGLGGRKLRMRKLVIEPGGVVPWHSHEKRPSNIYVISGSITEYRSTCSVPIEHGPGDVTAEFGPLSHWWKNNTKHPTVLISADLLSPDMNPDESM
jgi:quercetin dioxygenase-like cupin family protein